MRDWIAGTMTVLGALLVLSGGTIIVLRALKETELAGEATTTDVAPASGTSRLMRAARRMPPAERLIGWGLVVLVVAAVAAGAISFNLGADAGTR